MRFISLDAETNGLRGQAFAVAAIATNDVGTEAKSFVARCPIEGPVDPWVEANVLPAIADLAQTHDSYAHMLDELRYFLAAHDGHVIAHVAWPVEARLLLDAYPTGGPYPLIDVAGALLAHGHDPTSVDEFLAVRAANVEGFGSPHHPLYDAVAAERCLRILLTEAATCDEHFGDYEP